VNALAPTRALAQWAAGAGGCASGRALELAREAWLDVCACMVAGAHDEATERVAHAAAGWGAGPVSVVGRATPMSAPAAALVNGTAAHALDFDDNFHPMAGHATAVLVPAICALAERAGASGQSALDAYVAGLEACALIGDGIGLAHYERGWHSTSTIGAMAAAVACAHLLRLDSDGVQRAIGLGFSFASGSKRQFGTQAKPMHAGMAAMHGVMAADLAAAGVAPHAELLTGPWGFDDLFAGGDPPGFEMALARLGSPLAIERYGLKAKIHPCCASVHCAVDGVVALMREHALDARDIAGVDTVVARMSFDNLMYACPENALQARFSMQYAVALAVLQGGMRLADFAHDGVARPQVRAWLPRVKMRVAGAGDELTQVENGREPARVTLHLENGGTLQRFVQYPVGTLCNPMTDEQLAGKLEDCARARLDADEQARLRALALGLDAQPDLHALMALLRNVRSA
jgi:2-methylcitrate dehydratase PrpD